MISKNLNILSTPNIDGNFDIFASKISAVQLTTRQIELRAIFFSLAIDEIFVLTVQLSEVSNVFAMSKKKKQLKGFR